MAGKRSGLSGRFCSGCSLILMLLFFLFFIGFSNLALAQKKVIKVLIDDFESVGHIQKPEDYKYLEKGGPVMLRTALCEATKNSGIKFSFVERSKLAKILQEGGGIHQRLPEIFVQPKIKERLVAEGADYVIFTKFMVRRDNLVRVDARVTKVKDVSSEISVFHVFKADDLDPFQPLAEKIVSSLAENLFGSKTVSSKCYIVDVRSIVISVPKKYEKMDEIKFLCDDGEVTLSKSVLKNHVVLYLRTHLSKIKEVICKSPDEHEKTPIKLTDVAAMSHDIDFFVVGSIGIYEIKKNKKRETKANVNIFILNREEEVRGTADDICNPIELMNSDKVKSYVEDLKKDWINDIEHENKG